MLRSADGPGVFIQRDDRSRLGVATVRTDIAAFVGIAMAGPLGVPVRIETMRQFETVFGSYSGLAFLAYAVRAFFENGGRRCVVVRVASDDPELGAAPAFLDLPGAPAMRIAASSPGRWGNGLQVMLNTGWSAETLCPNPPTGGHALPVLTTEGFEAGALVRLGQPGQPDSYRVLAAVGPAEAHLHFVHPDPGQRRPTDMALAGLLPGVPVRIERVSLDLAVRRDGVPAAIYSRLGLVPAGPDFIGAVLRPLVPDDGVFERPPPPVVVEIAVQAATAVPRPPATIPGAWLSLTGGRDGLAELRAEDFLAGLASIERQPDVSILAVPDIVVSPLRTAYRPGEPQQPDRCAPCPVPAAATMPLTPPQPELPPAFGFDAIHCVQAAMIDQCERLRDRIALIDPPLAVARAQGLGSGPVMAWRQRFDSAFGALNFPWLDVADPLGPAPARAVPPSGHVAGRLAAMDLAVGPHRAPANVPLVWALAPTIAVDPPTHGILNDAGIDVIVARDGRPARLLGARSMSSDPDWRFLPVRRLVSMLRRAFDAATQWAVFEPNDDDTRALLAQSIGAFLESLRSGGALVGETPDAGWRVRCDSINNPAPARARGELVIDIAIAPAKPFEFIILRLGRSDAAFELVEQGRIASAQAGAA